MSVSAKIDADRDYKRYKEAFDEYCRHRDIRYKNLNAAEKKDRWRKFVYRWNHNQLHERYYTRYALTRPTLLTSTSSRRPLDSEEGVKKRKFGASLPTQEDLQLRREQLQEEEATRHEQEQRESLYKRRKENKEQKEKIQDLAPRADPGRDRRLEKTKETNAKMRSFREPSLEAEVGEDQLYGTGDDVRMSIAQEKKRQRRREEKRLEENMERDAERRERREAARVKEEATMESLRRMAEAKFG